MMIKKLKKISGLIHCLFGPKSVEEINRRTVRDEYYQEFVRKLDAAERIKDAWEDDSLIPLEKMDVYENAVKEYETALRKLNQLNNSGKG
ncbi:MAG: hypothetical protein GY702_16805 [Desulfobulbaceae bacterium]|nr:hypothetical protein [Desulfobulbaceae bacterium]